MLDDDIRGGKGKGEGKDVASHRISINNMNAVFVVADDEVSALINAADSVGYGLRPPTQCYWCRAKRETSKPLREIGLALAEGGRVTPLRTSKPITDRIFRPISIGLDTYLSHATSVGTVWVGLFPLKLQLEIKSTTILLAPAVHALFTGNVNLDFGKTSRFASVGMFPTRMLM